MIQKQKLATVEVKVTNTEGQTTKICEVPVKNTVELCWDSDRILDVTQQISQYALPLLYWVYVNDLYTNHL